MDAGNSITFREKKHDQSKRSDQTVPEKTRLSILYSVLCGFGFSIMAWGKDAILLARHYVRFPFLKLVSAGLLVLLISVFFGWLRSKTSSGLVKALTWILYIVFLVWLVQIMPTRFTVSVVSLAHPNLRGQLYYGEDQIGGIVAFLVGFFIVIAVGFCAVFEAHLIDGFQWPGKAIDKIKMVFFCLLVMGMAGYWSDQVINKELREPQIILAETFDFAREHWGEEVEAGLRCEWHLSALKELGEEVLSTPHFLLKSYDMGAMVVLVDLDGKQATCALIYSQPSRCWWKETKE